MKTFLDWITNPNTSGVVLRSLGNTLGTAFVVLIALGWSDEATRDSIINSLPTEEGLRGILGAIGAILSFILPYYIAWKNGTTQKALNVAKVVDKEVPKDAPVVELKTAGVAPDVPVPPAAQGNASASV